MKAAWLVVLLLVPWCQAAPLRLTLQQQNDMLHFSYRFAVGGEPQQLSFSLENKAISEHFRQFKPFKPTLLQHYLWRDIQRHVASQAGVTVKRMPRHDRLEYRLLSTDAKQLQQLAAELDALEAQQTAAYLQQEYYTQVRLANGQLAVVPDHPRLMQQSLPALLPVATAFHAKLQQLDVRQAIGYITEWLQQIPYQDLSDRLQSSGASFSPPLRLLRENRADCDSKAVLLAALIRMLLPDIKQAIIYLPGHAVLAVQLPVKQGDSSVTINGTNYILIDATGPALLPIGEISPEYKIFAQPGGFAYQLL
ncbi:MAG: hypothetical protein KKE30_01635 [Gammaproteobacteria bacterium]|nr:hypothetical protein [Gammaproteobacteria bacterium]MBU1555056.1 hypothetical protein [Gammaproteobacteria bacterium]MBU2072162.1 hypothetical protein [Gammaproteobacteria bacterium]MBU2182024.1 hypothetical protein [Gammaproteobacteria bacterium]MBU2203867.1 hypothetical protein [Gammaproteobacteria bacterium]